MTIEDDIEFVRKHMWARHERYRFPEGAKEPPFDPEDAGVPPAMFDGAVDDDGYVNWKLLPSTVTASDLDALEVRFGVRLPAIFRAYYSTYFHLYNQLGNGRMLLLMPAAPSDGPLDQLVQEIEAWEPLIAVGFLPFGAYQDGWGPICFDIDHQSSDGDYPIVWLEHETLPTPGTTEFSRETIRPTARQLYRSFRALFEDMFILEPSFGDAGA